MATWDDLFGSNGMAKGGGGSRYLKWNADGEEILVQVTGEPEARDQQIDGKTKWLVKLTANGKHKPMAEGDFDPENVANAFKPNEKDIVVPVRAIGKKDAGGKKVEDFEPFDTEWELSKGDMLEKTKAHMQDTGHALAKGAMVTLKRLDSTSKPHSFAVKIVKPAEG